MRFAFFSICLAKPGAITILSFGFMEIVDSTLISDSFYLFASSLSSQFSLFSGSLPPVSFRQFARIALEENLLFTKSLEQSCSNFYRSLIPHLSLQRMTSLIKLTSPKMLVTVSQSLLLTQSIEVRICPCFTLKLVGTIKNLHFQSKFNKLSVVSRISTKFLFGYFSQLI